MKNMTKSAILFAAAFMALPAAASASANTTPGWYAGLGAGVNFQRDTGDNTRNVPSFSFKRPGFDVLGDVGYAFGNGFRAEFEPFHSYSVVKHSDGYLANTDFFANALYDFDLGMMIMPYVGAGIGVDFSSANNIGPVGGAHYDDAATKMSYQGIAGFAVPIDHQWTVTADYRYIASLDPKYKNTAGNYARFDDASHNILLGVRYSFNVPAPVAERTTQAPQMMPKMVQKPVVAPVAHTYQVFFDFDKAELTPEAKRIIASAAAEYKKGGFVRIAVTGHTDTMGTTKYNQGLSDHRAAAVKAEFARLGVDANVVAAKGVGKNGLLVPTNDQVREAQNRRAEIVLDKK